MPISSINLDIFSTVDLKDAIIINPFYCFIYYLRFYHIVFLCQGTGSYPQPPPGLHREIRFIPIKVPRIKPYFSIACLVYSLQVGTNLHAARPPMNGDMHN